MSGLPAPFTTLTATPQQPQRHSLVIQNSEFLAFAARVDAPQQALEWVAALWTERPDASHVCWAYAVEAAYRFSDDGEPGGTAGAPILRALQGQHLGAQGIDHAAVLVARYYGGVNLGTGGLARAYGGVAAECLRLAEKLLVRPRVRRMAGVPFAQVSALYHLLGGVDALRGEETYTAQGLLMPLQLYPEDVDAFAAALRDATRGEGELRE